MREEIRRLQKQLGILLIYVTHDQEEAMSVSDRIAVFDRGRLRQLGKPEEIYADPSSIFVADFIGKANFVPARLVARDATGCRVQVAADHPNGSNEKITTRRHVLDEDESRKITGRADGMLMVRPEHMHLAPSDGAGFPCTIRRIQFLGSFTRYAAESPVLGCDLLIEATRPIAGLSEGDAALCDFKGADAIFYGKAP
jgi:ABC-type Fe3+/spermidine/putrescine transport system ATPase subunit